MTDADIPGVEIVFDIDGVRATARAFEALARA